MEKWSTKKLVEAGIMIALAMILNQIKVYKAVNGGSVTAGSMIPIMIFAIRWGTGPGIIAGIVFGILKIIFGGYIYSPIQVILEYPLAFGCLGLAGLFASKVDIDGKLGYVKLALSIFIAILGRFTCHLLAGVIFFGDTLPAGVNPWYASGLYQASYLVPEFIISVIILSIIWKPLVKLNK